jgi:hypothetical protein
LLNLQNTINCSSHRRLPLDRVTMDLATQGIALTPGGLYQAKAPGRGITFKIDASVGSGGPILSRLLRF